MDLRDAAMHEAAPVEAAGDVPCHTDPGATPAFETPIDAASPPEAQQGMFATQDASACEQSLLSAEAAEPAASVPLVEAHAADFAPLAETAPANAMRSTTLASSPPADTRLEDASAWPVTGVPDHALNAEFPAPPLDPAGAMAAQSGFYSPG
jgi:hypothetical protein